MVGFATGIKLKRAALSRLAGRFRGVRRVLGPTGVAEARALSASIAGRVHASGLYVRFARLRYVISLRNAGGRDGRPARAIPARRPLRRATALGKAFGVVGRVAHLHILAHPAVLQRDLRVGMTIGLLRRALTATAGANRPSFPPRFRERRVAFTDPALRFANALLLVANGHPVHDRLHVGHTAR